MWFNMREEPVIYINGNPYVVREANKPFANLEYTGLLCKPLPASHARLLIWVMQCMLPAALQLQDCFICTFAAACSFADDVKDSVATHPLHGAHMLPCCRH